LPFYLGSTGKPKGVEISHKNILSCARSYYSIVKDIIDINDNHIYISYLPLSHIFEFVTEFLLFVIGVKIGYSSPLTLIDTSSCIRKGDHGDITLLRPTILPSVPLVLDRISKEVYDNISRLNFLVNLIKSTVRSGRVSSVAASQRPLAADRRVTSHTKVGFLNYTLLMFNWQ
jgi:long-subunit acyl-CoA synthetase (AMP-forming)